MTAPNPILLLNDCSFTQELGNMIVAKYTDIEPFHSEWLCQIWYDLMVEMNKAVESGLPFHEALHLALTSLFLAGHETALLQLSKRQPE